MRKFILSILFLLVVGGLPTAAHAVTAIVRVFNDTSTTPLISYTISGTGNPLPLTRTATSTGSKGYGNGAGCETLGSSTSGACFTISGQARFLSDTNKVGQLKLEGPSGTGKFVVKNTGNATARIKIEYKHTNTATDPKNTTVCSGMSGDGWFSGTSSTANRPFFEQTMSVVFTTSSGGKITNPVNGSNPSTCDDPLVSGTSSPLRYELGVTGTSTFYNPQIPKQLFQRIPTCSSCILGAELNKTLTLRLPVGGINNHVGTHLGSICEVPGRRPSEADFLDCNRAQGSLYISKEARFVIGNSTLKEGDKGKILGDLLGGENFDVLDVKTDPTTGQPACRLFAGDRNADDDPFGKAVHSVFDDFDNDGRLDIRMQFQNADVQPQLGDDMLTLKCDAEIFVRGEPTNQTITTADEVVVTH